MSDDGLESINALIEERCPKVDHWQNSCQRHRWLATALLDIEHPATQGDGPPGTCVSFGTH